MRLTPDGDSVVIAFYNPGDPENGLARLYRLRDAALLDQWQVPRSPRVTCPAFVDHPDGVGLVLTTAVEGMPTAQRRLHPDAGTLFWADTDLEGPVPQPDRFVLAGGSAI
jgi:sugar lactone lactonase YvrE